MGHRPGEDLEERIIDGKAQYYLLPGKRSQVSAVSCSMRRRGRHAVLVGRLDPRVCRCPNNYIERISVVVGAP